MGSSLSFTDWTRFTQGFPFVGFKNVRLILFIRSQGKDTLSRKVYKQLKLNKWPGLAEETAKICQVLGIENVNFTRIRIHI